MRAVALGIAMTLMGALVPIPAGAQAAAAQKKAPTTFSGVKLLDLHARKPEQNVTLRLTDDALKIVDPASKAEVATLPYSGIAATHRVSSAPPPVAGDPAAAATQPMAPPMYMGKTPHNWLTLKSGTDTIVLRVSERVYAQLKDALAAHNVQVQEDK
jgi:hypothetical protein